MSQTDDAYLYLYCPEEILELDNFTDNHKESIGCDPAFWEEDDEISCLLAKQVENNLYKLMQTNPFLDLARCESVEWMLKVSAQYSFSSVTPVVAVDYLDRFLQGRQLQREKPWMTQLIAVTCLSLAAKMQEIQVPLLSDLQVVEHSKYVFDAKTITRMEILVLSTLEWRMNPVTPFSFLDYITRKLGLKDYCTREFPRRCERIILSLISDSGYTRYVPSVMATSVMLQVIPSFRSDYQWQGQLLEILGTCKDRVDECSKLVTKLGSGFPGSPDHVMDLSFSSENSNYSSPSSV